MHPWNADCWGLTVVFLRLPPGFPRLSPLHVTRQIHGVVEDAKNVDDRVVRFPADAEQDDVSASSLTSGDMQRANICADVVAHSRPDDIGAFRQGGERVRERLGVGEGLVRPEASRRPLQDVLEVD